MAQALKPDIRNRINAAAINLFSSKGFQNCTMADIAKLSGMSVGNLYCYYRSKEILLEEIVPVAQTTILLDTMTQRMRNFSTLPDIQTIVGPILANRLLLGFLVFGAAGTIHADFPIRLVDSLVIAYQEFASKHFPLSSLFDVPHTMVLVRGLYQNLITLLANLIRSTIPDHELPRLLELALITHTQSMIELLKLENDQESL